MMLVNTFLWALACLPFIVSAAPSAQWKKNPKPVKNHPKPIKPWKPSPPGHGKATITEIIYYVPTVLTVTKTKCYTKYKNGKKTTVTDTQTITSTSSIPTTTTATIYETATSVSVSVVLVTATVNQTVPAPTTISITETLNQTISVTQTLNQTISAPTTILVTQTINQTVTSNVVSTASTYPQATGRALFAKIAGMDSHQAVSPGATTNSQVGPPFGYSIRDANTTNGLYLFVTSADEPYNGQNGAIDFYIDDPATAAAVGADSCYFGYATNSPYTADPNFNGIAYYTAPECTRDGFTLTQAAAPIYFIPSDANAKANTYNSLDVVYTAVGTGTGVIAAPTDGSGNLIIVFPPSSGAALVFPVGYQQANLFI